MFDASAQPPLLDDTLVITLTKDVPSRWPTLFSNATAKRYIPPPPPPKPETEAAKERKRALDVKKRNALFGIGPIEHRKFDPEREKKSEWRREVQAREQRAELNAVSASASEHWPSHSAMLLWRDGLEKVEGAPDHPAECGPLFSWTEDSRVVVVSASTRRGLAHGKLSCKPRPSSIDCFVDGVATPWCGPLVGKIDPDKCSLEVLPNPDPDALTDTLRLTLVKSEYNRLWRAPWPELIQQIDLRERRGSDKPRRDVLMIGGFDCAQRDGLYEIILPFKELQGAHYLSHDDLRVAVTTDCLNVHVAGQEDAPLLAGQLQGAIDPARCRWRVRKPKKKKSAPVPTEEIVIELAKQDAGKLWNDLFKVAYV